jgi:hypothetical protein
MNRRVDYVLEEHIEAPFLVGRKGQTLPSHKNKGTA